MRTQYTLVEFPEVQEYMEAPWFEIQSSLADIDNFGPGAYFIPTKYVKKFIP